MSGLEKIEAYLVDLGVAYEEVAATTWLVDDPAMGIPAIMISLVDPIVVVRASVMKLPPSGHEALFRTLLTLNADDIVHGAYALEGEDIILIDTLECESLDKSELQASLDAISFALARHLPLLSRLVKG
jgi:hypothetical protein